MDARTEAAAKAIAIKRTNRSLSKPGSLSFQLADVALAAADAVEAPLAEQLATALREWIDNDPDAHLHRSALDVEDVDPDLPLGVCVECEYRWPCYVEHSRRLLAVFDAARADSGNRHQGDNVSGEERMSQRAWCCQLDCGNDAEYEIVGNESFHPDDDTQSCAEHIGALLGEPEGARPNKSWTVRLLTDAEVVARSAADSQGTHQ